MITYTNAKDFMPILQAIVDGKIVVIGDGSVSTKQFDFSLSPENYKIIEPPKPPKKVPLTFEDMEPGCHIGRPLECDVYAIINYDTGGIYIHNRSFSYGDFMHADFEIFRPSTGKWEPAYKLQADES